MRERLRVIRRIIGEAIPEAAEKISWSMPTYWKGLVDCKMAHQKRINAHAMRLRSAVRWDVYCGIIVRSQWHNLIQGLLVGKVLLNLSSSVQSRNTQRSERQQRFPEPEVVILIRTAPRQPPRSGCLGRLSGKCYTGKSTGQVEACLIPIAVGGSATAFSRRSVKTGGNRNVSPDFVSCVS